VRRQSKVMKALIGAIMCGVVLIGPTAAIAGNCEDTKRKRDGRVVTNVKAINETFANVRAGVYWRNPYGPTTTWQVLKEPKQLASGKKIDVTDRKVNSRSYKITFTGINAQAINVSCFYEIDNLGDKGEIGLDSTAKSSWSEWKCNGTTPKYRITCSKSFNPDKDRWNTKIYLREKY